MCNLIFIVHNASCQTSPRERETRKAGVGLGKSGRPTVSIKTLVFFAEDISNHPLGVYKVNNSFREKVVLFDEMM